MKLAVRVPNWLGDAVMALPAIRGIVRCAEERGDTVTIVSRPPLAPVFAGFRTVTADRESEIGALRTLAPDRILLLTHSFSTVWAAWRAGTPERWGEGRHMRSPFLTKVLRPADGFLHQIDEYGHIATEAGYAVDPHPPRLEPLPRSDRADLPAGPYIVLAPGARYGAAKRWPRFPELAHALAERQKAVVVLGAKGEGVGASIDHELIHDLTGQTPLAEALAIVAHADAVVSNDSGLAHAAAALERRTIVIFGPTESKRTAPRAAAGLVTILHGSAECAPCLRRTCPIDHRCLADLPIRSVLEAVAP